MLVCILAAFLAALVHLAWHTGVTVDEPSHLVSSYFYWHGHDNLKPRDMPPLIKAVGGWVPRLLGLPIPYDRKDIWNSQHEWPIALEVMERLRVRVPKVFFLSRLPLLVFPLGVALLIWWWARRIFSPVAGIVLAAAFCLEPTVLGHGPLFKNDLAATFGYLLFWYRAWVYWRKPSPANAAWLGLGLTVAVLAKLSMLILLAIAPLVIVVRGLTLSPRRYRALALGLVLVTLIPYLGSIAACQFDTRRAFGVLPMPEPLWDGTLSLMQAGRDAPDVFFLGRRIGGGNLFYFLAALAMKVPVPLQLLLLGGLLLEARALRRKEFDARRLFWIAPPWLYIGLASFSSFQLGVRLVLPALALALLACGPAVEWLLPRRRAVVLAGLFALLAARTAWVYPHNISFFNLWLGNAEYGARLLSDSNVDWGQDLRELATVVHQAGIREFHLSYFGSDCVWAYFTDKEAIPLAPPWSGDLATGPVYRPEPGYYAISASLLPGHLFEKPYQNYYRAFWGLEPVAKAGYSIYVYRIDPLPAEVASRQ
ncbi:MAG: hypothetical protein HY822_12615 [Acidobacteria bacterium]|nr:hypothetical protein [Acidobacteriota bacterium]